VLSNDTPPPPPKKSLKIPKGESESVDQRINITMAKRTNNDLQNISQNTKDRVTRSTLKTGGELVCSGRVSCSCPTSGTCHIILVRNLVISHECDHEMKKSNTNFDLSIFLRFIFLDYDKNVCKTLQYKKNTFLPCISD
jgi:hypothetical protein